MSMLLCLLPFCGLASIALICGLLAWPHLVVIWPSIREEIERFRRLHPLAKVAALVFVVGFIAYGSTKTNQVDQTSGTNGVEIVEGGTNDVNQVEEEGEQWNLPIPLTSGETPLLRCTPLTSTLYPPVTPEDIARGWQQVEVRTNCNISYEMPEGATLATNWWVRGAFEDVKEIGLGSLGGLEGWRFPFGSNEYDSTWAFSWGKIRFTLADTNEIVAVGAPMSAVPYCSRLWSAETTNGARLVTWENFVLGRAGKEEVLFDSSDETSLPRCVNAQIELKRNGDFVTRSNEVETVCRRVDPDDYDGDGWENGDDPDPCAWDEFWESFHQELPDGDDECNYCWIEIRPQWNSWIEFEGDGPSNLEDPCFWGKAGETYRVMLLIGKTYDVTSTQPLSVVGQSDAAIRVYDGGPCSFTVVWPVTFTVGEGRYATRPLLGATWNDGGRSFYVLRDPPFLRGDNFWSGGCCLITGDGTNYTFTCDNACVCEGCMSYGFFIYSGYMLDLPGWFECGCHYVHDEGPTNVSISFDRSAVIYEDPYTNMPGEEVHPMPSNAVLRCEVNGGTYGGRLTIAFNEAGQRKIARVGGSALPNNVQIQPGMTRVFEVEYTPLEPSTNKNDIVVTATFVEDFLNESHTATAMLTSVKVELNPQRVAIGNSCSCRHVYGVDEYVNAIVTPSGLELRWVDDVDVDVDLNNTSFWCPWQGGTYRPTLICEGVSYQPTLHVFEPRIVCRAASWDGVVGVYGEAGHVRMNLSLYVEPTYVSFEGLHLEEIPVDGEGLHTGYFDDRSKGGEWTHTCTAGAGRWSAVDAVGYWTNDAVGVNEYSMPWSVGWKQWQIPVGWGIIGSLKGRIQPDPTTQDFFIYGSGTVTVQKYGHTITRTIENEVQFNGVQVHW